MFNSLKGRMIIPIFFGMALLVAITIIFIALSNEYAIFSTSALRSTLIFFGLGGLALSIVVMYLMVLRLLKSLESLTQNAKEIAYGNMKINLDTARKDEFGQVSNAFAEVIKSINLLRKNIEFGVKRMKRGNVLHKFEDSRLQGAFAKILVHTNDIAKEFVYSYNELTDPFIYVDKHCKIQYANPVIMEMTGKKANVIGMHINDFLNGDIANHPITLEAFSSGHRNSAEIQLQLNSNHLYDLEYRCTPFAVDGKIECVLLVLVDITNIRNMQRWHNFLQLLSWT